MTVRTILSAVSSLIDDLMVPMVVTALFTAVFIWPGPYLL